MITNEKRAFKRVKHKFTVKFTQHGPSSRSGVSVTENISLGGIYFTSLHMFNIGDLLDCAVDAEAAGELSWLCRVVRCEKMGKHMLPSFGIAVEFVKASGDTGSRLQSIL